MSADHWYLVTCVGHQEVREMARRAVEVTGRPQAVHNHEEGQPCRGHDGDPCYELMVREEATT